MRALQIAGYADQPIATLVDVPVAAPRPGEVRVRIEAAALNPLDAKLAQGHFQVWFPLTFPYVPGTDFAGIVDEPGEGVESFQVGDAVFGRADPTAGGALAEFVTLQAELVARRQPSLDASSAACLPTPAGVAYQALFEVLKRPAGSTLLILGAGAVARAAVQLAIGEGEVLICGPGAERLKSVGATVITQDSADLATAAERAAFVFDTSGGDLQATVVSMLKPSSHVAAIVTPVDETQAQARSITADYVVLATKQTTLDQLGELAAASTLSVEITGNFTLEQAPSTFGAYVAGTLPGKHIMQGEVK
jgi:NADPH:quinone reductase-like Zn-dependent oxidoreductase